ncbi:MAG: hypothetical protein KDD72_01570, partial [Anaerolineales bacterium]|nr:hypothetical protein [Anaerolineales bacterium]
MRKRIRFPRFIFILLVSSMLILPVQSAGAIPAAGFSEISFVPNIETAGVVVSGAGLPASAKMTYRLSGDSVWHSGHDLLRIKDGRLIGSLFNLAPSSTYEVKVSDGVTEIGG